MWILEGASGFLRGETKKSSKKLRVFLGGYAPGASQPGSAYHSTQDFFSIYFRNDINGGKLVYKHLPRFTEKVNKTNIE